MLALMLERYPDIVSCSELQAFLLRGRRPLQCISHGTRCSLWSNELVERLLAEGPTGSPHRLIAEYSHCKCVVDASKILEWYSLVLRPLESDNVVCVFISKSPAKFTASHLHRSKEGSRTIDGIALRWGMGNLRNYVWLKRNGRIRDWMHLKYLDLASRPDDVLQKILGQCGLDYRQGQERFWEREHHPLWGNQTVLLPIAPQTSTAAWSIEPDARWKEVSEENLEAIYNCLLVRICIRILGYPDLLQGSRRSWLSGVTSHMFAIVLPNAPFIVTDFVCRVVSVMHRVRENGWKHATRTELQRLVRIGRRLRIVPTPRPGSQRSISHSQPPHAPPSKKQP